MTTATVTTSWSVEQEPVVRFLSKSLALEIARLRGQTMAYTSTANFRKVYRQVVSKLVNGHINLYGHRLKDLDPRPVTSDIDEIWAGRSFFQYTTQGLLEDVIAECESLGVDPDIMKMLQDSV